MILLRSALHTLVLISVLLAAPAKADQATIERSGGEEYDLSSFSDHFETVKWETAGLFAGITVLGAMSWNWGSQNHFKMNSEGWFGPNTGSGGSDKLGHAFTTYLFTDVLTDALTARGKQPENAALSSAIIAMGLMTYVEIFDGYSADHGFSYEDMIMDLLGAGFAYARNTRPRLRETVDFRLSYLPSGYKGFRPLSDYAGQKYLLAFKPAGLAAVERSNSLLKYLELHVGYYARGFTQAERREGVPRSTEHYLGIGLNLNEILFGKQKGDRQLLRRSGRLFFEHIQLPYTSVNYDVNN